MAWTSLSFSFGAILTSAQMNQLQANFSAVAAGDSGAPAITEAALDTPLGPWVKLATLDASTGTTVETATSLFSGYTEILAFGAVTHGSGTSRDLYARYKSGASAISSANYEVAAVEISGTLVGGSVTGSTFFDFSDGTVGQVTAGNFAPILMHIMNLTGDYGARLANYKYGANKTTAITTYANGIAALQTTDVVDGIQFYWSGSVAFNGGQIEIWGHK